MPRGWSSPSTSQAIKRWILEHGNRGTAPEISEDLAKKFWEMGYDPPDHQSIAQILNACRKLGLVKVVGKESVEDEVTTRGIRRLVYSVVEEKATSKKWNNPVTAYYNKPREFEKTPFR